MLMVGCFLRLRRVTSVCTGGAGGQAWAESSEGLRSGPAPRPPGFVTSGEELRESEPVFGGVDGKTNTSRGGRDESMKGLWEACTRSLETGPKPRPPSLSSSSHSPASPQHRQGMGPPESSPKTGLSSLQHEGALHGEGGE